MTAAADPTRHDVALDQAVSWVMHARPTPDPEWVALGDLPGRRLSRAVRLRMPMPPFACSAMDGMAVRSADTPGVLRLTGESAAGRPGRDALGTGEAWHISTGAVVPHGADAVVRIEDVTMDGDRVTVPATPVGADIRQPGSSRAEGAVLLEAGDVVAPHEVGLVAASGWAGALCTGRLRVALAITGDELVAPGEPLGPGQVYDINRWALAAQITAAGAELTAVARLSDRADEVEAVLAELVGAPDAPAVDVLVTSGGLSVGRHDHVWRTLTALGFGDGIRGIMMRPGHPTSLARRGAQVALCCPGNPGAASIVMHLLGRPLLGGPHPWEAAMALRDSVAARPDTARIVRGFVDEEDFRPRDRVEAGAAVPLGRVTGLALIPPGDRALKAGDRVLVSLL